MASTNHKGQTAADVRAERVQEARNLALGILEAVELAALKPEPALGWDWGHAGDWGSVVERLQDGHGLALGLTVDSAGLGIGRTIALAQTFLRVRSLLAGAVPAPVQTYQVQRNGRTIRVTVPESSR